MADYDIEQSLPDHKCGLYITHNEYKDCYEYIADAVCDLDGDWASSDEKLKALDTGQIWTIQWYPDTPVGFHRVAASTLSAAIEAANRDE
jgi:hypothetical protein